MSREPRVSLHARYNEAKASPGTYVGLVDDLRDRAQIIQTVFDKVFGERFDLSTLSDLEWVPAIRSPHVTALFHAKGLVLLNLDFWGGQRKVTGTIHPIPEWCLSKDLGRVLRTVRKKARDHKTALEGKRRAELNKNEALETLAAQYHVAKSSLERENWTGKFDVQVSVCRTAAS